MKKSNIGIIINSFKNCGPCNVVLNMINEINYEKYNVFLITLFDSNEEQMLDKVKDKVKIIELNKASKLEFLLKGHLELNDVIKENKLDLIHSHGFIPDVVCSRLKEVLKVCTIHNNMFEDYIFTYGKLKGKIYCMIHIKALANIQKVVCCSKSSYDVLVNKIKNKDRITYVRNGATTEKKYDTVKVSRKELGIPEDAKVYIYVGCLNERKKVENLVKEFVRNHLENEYLLVLGTGDKYTTCLEVKDDKVLLLGYKNNVLDYYQISDYYVSFSSAEGFSISIIEALESGLALLLSNIPSHRECFEIDENYNVGKYFNYDEFNVSIEEFRNNGFSKQQIMEFQQKYLSAKSMTTNYEKIYKELLWRR